MFDNYDHGTTNQRDTQVRQNDDKCIFFDGISHFTKNSQSLESFGQMMREICEDENKEVFIHILCKSANKTTSTCSSRFWISISIINHYCQDEKMIDQQEIFLLYTGYPYSLNLFSIKNESIDQFRLILESATHPKIFATKEMANDAVNIFFNYFKINVKSASFLARDNNIWTVGLDSFRNSKVVKYTIQTSMEKYYINSEDLFWYIHRYVTSLQTNDPLETDNFNDVIILLTSFHWVMSTVREKKIMLY